MDQEDPLVCYTTLSEASAQLEGEQKFYPSTLCHIGEQGKEVLENVLRPAQVPLCDPVRQAGLCPGQSPVRALAQQGSTPRSQLGACTAQPLTLVPG